jgi:hypothetical protein
MKLNGEFSCILWNFTYETVGLPVLYLGESPFQGQWFGDWVSATLGKRHQTTNQQVVVFKDTRIQQHRDLCTYTHIHIYIIIYIWDCIYNCIYIIIYIYTHVDIESRISQCLTVHGDSWQVSAGWDSLSLWSLWHSSTNIPLSVNRLTG